ncbi:hypothetical protein [Phenylobacterium sp.]|uniref:hypothetical protein n=1 Tax=Phenylobacterium sp. TaxID=1871053 RepID=UPI0025E77747|nr:hypothetical protein [Phenylobacterium sp.]MBX3485734.1 hypothetical protein [Phenylobacterium sp.]MCW5759068.1 hypothetical protein [Phenylobacterium sp.]
MTRRFLLGGVLALAACMPTTHSYRYVARDHPVSVVVEPTGQRVARPGRRNDVFLLGEFNVDTPTGGRLVEDRVRLGSFAGLWNPAAIAWIDDTTVNICPLAGSPTVPATATVRVSETERKTYRITTDCPAALRNAARRRSEASGPSGRS